MSDVVLNGPLLAALALAAAAGLVSFASPCVLPLVPGFLGYITGMTPDREQANRGTMLVGASLFVGGFSAVFIAMSVVVSSLGLLLQEHQSLLLRLGGVVVLALGVFMVGATGGGWQPRWRPAAGLLGAPALGVVFGLGFTACTGPSLAAIQTLGASLAPGEGTSARAVLLAIAYCLGLGVPFLAIAGGAGWASAVSVRLRRHHAAIQRTSGVVLIVLAVLLITGLWAGITAWTQTQLVSSFETVL
ncbi:MAG: cytochrome c biogenesis CcdA family protein [Ornithinimicrobium sp.]